MSDNLDFTGDVRFNVKLQELPSTFDRTLPTYFSCLPCPQSAVSWTSPPAFRLIMTVEFRAKEEFETKYRPGT